MPKPITPLAGCDVFVIDEKERVLLIRRSDNGRWALPGGCQDLGETPAECAIRECYEETGYHVSVDQLLGVFSSQRYEYIHYPWKENEFLHVLFAARRIGGTPKISAETTHIGWFLENDLPELSDGHEIRIRFGFHARQDPSVAPHFE